MEIAIEHRQDFDFSLVENSLWSEKNNPGKRTKTSAMINICQPYSSFDLTIVLLRNTISNTSKKEIKPLEIYQEFSC